MAETISFNEFKKMDIRVATVKKCEPVEGADKLYKITVSIGELGERTLAAGIKPNYAPEELEGKKIVVLTNLEPKTVRGIESQGMLLAACTDDFKEVKLVLVDEGAQEGWKVC